MCVQSFHQCFTCNSRAFRRKSTFGISCFSRHKSACHCLVPSLHSLRQVSLQTWDPWQYLGSVCCELNASCWRLHNFPLPASLPACQFSHRRWGFITKNCYSLSQNINIKDLHRNKAKGSFGFHSQHQLNPAAEYADVQSWSST